MLITGTAYKIDFASVAVRMLAISGFLSAENLLAELDRENENCSYNNHADNNRVNFLESSN